ncbi:ABC transporter ATP-binding protein [Paracoccus sp. WLY502]|uniref:ABC transporter ATP-binding protein n=1 Tax=Paracoccus yibinensis TaxID=3068891 RepID=UPI0027964FC7|nr:ABC transporter ATP-binding protein [Paracoccus sp. WLY502]MDQ1902142.1 ABC transporter ATP-binding protein [Paracoccus sp. WLY502]
MARIQLRNLSKRWGSFVGLKPMNLDINDGEFLVLLGPSGCGKTTTMRMIAGLEDASEGDIMIGERRVNDLEPKDRDIAMVFQSYGLYPTMTVYENIRFPLKVRGIPQAEHHDRVMRAAAAVELNEFLERKPAALSGGQRQRVALARAIVRKPKVFLMDEPLSNLDAKLRVSTRAQIKNLHHELQTTTIYVTHDQIEAMTLADRVVVMSRGEVQQIGTPLQIYDRPANTFVAGFIGSPAMNLIAGEIRGGVFEAANVRIPGFAGVSDGKVTLGFRAEDAGLAPAGEIAAPVYSMELLGDSSMATVQAGGALVAIRAAKNFSAQIGDPIAAHVPAGICHLFDPTTGQRIDRRTVPAGKETA